VSTLSADLEQAVRAIVRDEIAKAGGSTKPATPPPGGSGVTPSSTRCGFKSNAGVCTREQGHLGQRHRYEKNPAPEHIPPARNWKRARGFYKKSGTKNFLIEVGHPCRVEGERGMWKVVGVEFGTGPNEGKINVEVKTDRTGHSRTFSSDRIIYKRPKKVS
jgi:hypothetical protein